MATATKHRFRITASVEDYGELGVFDAMTGGETDSTDTKHHSGGMGPEEALGGPATTSNTVISRSFRPVRDHPLRKRLRPKCGVKRMRVKRQILDEDGNAFGEPEVFSGILKRVDPINEVDSDSGDAAMLEIEMSTDEQVA
jgi:hypothetical protein